MFPANPQQNDAFVSSNVSLVESCEQTWPNLANRKSYLDCGTAKARALSWLEPKRRLGEPSISSCGVLSALGTVEGFYFFLAKI